MSKLTTFWDTVSVPIERLPIWLSVVGLAGFIVAGIAFKIHVHNIPRHTVDFRLAVIPFLENHGFRVETTGPETVQSRVVATRASCRLQVVDAEPRGFNRDSIRRLAGPTDDFFVVFDGALYSEQPLWRTKLSYYGRRLLQEVGIMVAPSPVFAVIASAFCSARQYRWQDLT